MSATHQSPESSTRTLEIREWVACDIQHRLETPCTSSSVVIGTHRHHSFLIWRWDRCHVHVLGTLLEARVRSNSLSGKHIARYSSNGLTLETPADLARITP